MKWLLLPFVALPLTATTLFLQGPPTDNSMDMVAYRLADDFSLGQGSVIDTITFWYQAQQQGDLAQVSWAFYNDAGGALGSLIASGASNPTLSTIVNAFQAVLPIPALTLGAGTFWLELHSGSSLTDTSGFAVSWANSAGNASNLLLYSPAPSSPATPSAIPGYTQLAFQLSGTSVPEPASLSMAAVAVCLFCVRRALTARKKGPA